MNKIRLAVIFGGKSGEHEVSLSSASAVLQALDKNKYEIIPVAITKNGDWLFGEDGQKYIDLNKSKAGKEGSIKNDDPEILSLSQYNPGFYNFTKAVKEKKIDLVFPIIHGPFGEDGRLQGFLDIIGAPYVFSGVLAHAIAMNKPKAKILVKNCGVPTPDSLLAGKDYDVDEILKRIKFPIFVKPAELGSSVGVSMIKTSEDLRSGIDEALRYGNEVLLEEYIKGREFTVTVMESEEIKALAVTEIVPLISEFYDYKAKYEIGGSKHVTPADIPKEIENKLKQYAVIVFKAIECKDLARADFIWDETKNECYFIELNTIPGMTATSLAPEAAKLAGYSFTEFLDALISNKNRCQ